MLIVIVIIGILAAALIPRLTGIQGRARDTARKADLSQIGTSLATLKLDTNVYPSSTSWATGVETGILSGLSAYMNAIPKENAAGYMTYAYVSNGSTFALASVSEGGKANANWSGTSAISMPANLSWVSSASTTASDLANQLCKDGATSTTCIGTTASWAPRYVYVN